MNEKIKKYNYFNHDFKNNPNLKFNSYILTYDKYPGKIAEIFISVSNSKIYIITNNNNFLDIYESNDNINIHKKLSFNNHKTQIKVVKYFIDKKNYSEYLLSADNNTIYIWDITNNFQNKYKIDLDGSNLIDCLLIFSNDIIDKDYIFASSSRQTLGMNCYLSDTKMYSVDNKFIKNLETVEGYLYHLLLWHDKINNNYYILIITIEYISIYNLSDWKLYCKLDNYTCDFKFNLNANKADHAYIYQKDNTYFFVDLNYHVITIWDLFRKNKYKEIRVNIKIFNEKLNKDDIYKLKRLVKWNNKYAIVINEHWRYHHEYTFLQIIDLELGKVITKINQGKDEKKSITFMKKLIHPIYGESLIAIDNFTGVQLWTNN